MKERVISGIVDKYSGTKLFILLFSLTAKEGTVLSFDWEQDSKNPTKQETNKKKAYFTVQVYRIQGITYVLIPTI